MDKDAQKRLLRDAGIPTARFLVVRDNERASLEFGAVCRKLGQPFFVKPANLGSSVGISKVTRREELDPALREAFRYDRKALIEEFIKGREIECSVLGNDRPMASVPGEVIPSHEFYSYEAKYLDARGARFEIPARLPRAVNRRVRSLAARAFQVLCCEGMARVDFFLRGRAEVLVNEINTIPGFTAISQYPKLWEASGLPLNRLVDRLIALALERHRRNAKLKTSR